MIQPPPGPFSTVEYNIPSGPFSDYLTFENPLEGKVVLTKALDFEIIIIIVIISIIIRDDDDDDDDDGDSENIGLID